jgi:hypothetical protein
VTHSRPRASRSFGSQGVQTRLVTHRGSAAYDGRGSPRYRARFAALSRAAAATRAALTSLRSRPA